MQTQTNRDVLVSSRPRNDTPLTIKTSLVCIFPIYPILVQWQYQLSKKYKLGGTI